MSVPVVLQVMARQDPSVRKTLDDIASETRRALAAQPVQILPPSALEGTRTATELLRQMREQSVQLTRELVGVRDELNQLGTTGNLSQQAQGYTAIAQRLREVGQASEDARRINPQLQASFETLTRRAQEGLQQVAERARNLAEVGQLVTGALAGIGTVFGGAAVGALTVAANFEQLQAKLVSVTGSVQEATNQFKFAQQFAANTPFDVEGIVQATVLIKGFQQSSEQLLPVVANLASAMGTDLQQAALAVSKAAAGSYEGFENLRNTYAIQTSELKKFGAETDRQGVLQIRTAQQIEKAREAMIKIIQLRYGDAIARQSQTLKGALSNVGDAAKNLLGSVGSSLVPIGTLGARSISFLLNGLNALPNPIKAAGAAGAVFVAGVAGLGAAATGAVTAMLLLQAQLAGLAAQQIPAAVTATNFLSGAMERLTLQAGRARLAMVAFATNPLTLVLLGIGSAAAVAQAAISSYEQSAVQAGEAVVKSSREIVSANQGVRQGVALLNEAGRSIGANVPIVRDSAEQTRLFQAALKNLTPEQLTAAMDRLGVSADGLKTQMQQSENQIKANKERIAELKRELEILQPVLDRGLTEGAYIPPGVIERVKELKTQISSLVRITGQRESALAFFQGMLDKLNQLTSRLQPLIDKTNVLSGNLDLSKRIGTTQALATALADANTQIAENAKDAAIGSDNLDTLLAKYKALGQGPAEELQRTAIKKQIDAILERDAIEKQIQSDRDKLTQDEQARLEREFRLTQVNSNAKLNDELRFVQGRLQAARQGSEEYVQLRERESELLRQIQKRQEDDARASLKRVLDEAQQAVRDAEAGRPGGPTAATGPQLPGAPFPQARTGADEDPLANQRQVIASLEDARRRVDAWAQANAGLIRQYPALAQELAKFRADNALDVQREKAELLKSAVAQMGQDLQTRLSEATTSTAKLEIVNAGILQLKRGIASGLLAEAEAQRQVNQLVGQRAQLERQISQEAEQRRRQTASLELQNAEQELQILEARKAAGERVDDEIAAKRQQILDQKLAEIEAEKNAAIEAAQGQADAIEQIERQAQLRRENLENSELLRRVQEYGKLEQEQARSLSKREAAEQRSMDKMAKDRVGGPNSPLRSIADAFSDFSFGPAFSFDSAQKVVPKVAAREPAKARYQQTQQAVAAATRTSGQQVAGAKSNTTINNNNTVVVKGQQLGREAAKSTRQFMKQASIQRALTRGGEYPSEAYPSTGGGMTF